MDVFSIGLLISLHVFVAIFGTYFLKKLIDKKKLVQGIESNLVQLRRSNRLESIGTLAAGIAHDFNNILQAIQGHSEYLKLDLDQESDMYKGLVRINEAAIRGSKLTNQLLTFSSKVESKLIPMHLNDRIIEMQDILFPTIPKHINIKLNLNSNLDPIKADSAQIEQIILNLCLNARDAMKNGGIMTITTENVTLSEEYCTEHIKLHPGDYVKLSISDNGIGMSKYVKNHLFEPFFTTKKDGTGLGLSIVYGIVKNHKAYIICYSEEGVGTEMKIYFPKAKITDVIEKAKVIPSKLKNGTETILLVDDEEDILEFGSKTFKRYGYKVYIARNGFEAIKAYQTKRIDLVILDLIMPIMSGQETLQKLIEMDPNVKVIISSGYSVDGHVRKTLELGAKDIVSKPYDIKNMMKTIQETLQIV